MASRHRLFHFTAARFLYLICIVIFPFLMTHVLKTETYSKFIFFSTIIATIIEVLNLGIPYGVKRVLLEKNDKEKQISVIILKISLLFFLLSFLFITIGILFWFYFFPETFEENLLFLIVVWISGFLGLGTLLFSNYIYGIEKFGWYAIQEVVFSISRIIIIPLMALKWNLTGALIGLIIVQSIVFIINISGINPLNIYNGIVNPIKITFSDFKKFGGYSLKWYLCNFCEQGYRFSAIFILAAFSSKQNPEVGFLHLSFFAVSAVSMLYTAWLNAFFPAFSYYHDNKNFTSSKKLGDILKKYLVLVAGLIVFLVFMFMDNIVKMLPGDYYGVSSYIKLIIILAFFRAISMTLNFKALAEFKMNEYMKANFIWMFIYIISFTIGGYYSKGIGILIGAIISEVLYTLIFNYLSEKSFMARIYFLIACLLSIFYIISLYLAEFQLFVKILAVIFACVILILIGIVFKIIRKSDIHFLSETASIKKSDVILEDKI